MLHVHMHGVCMCQWCVHVCAHVCGVFPCMMCAYVCTHVWCVLTHRVFNLYAEYIMQHAGLDEAQAGMKISGRNISSLRYAEYTTLMGESKEKSFLMKVN